MYIIVCSVEFDELYIQQLKVTQNASPPVQRKRHPIAEGGALEEIIRERRGVEVYR